MDKKLHFTQARIRGLPIPEKGRIDYSDTQTDKLVCRVSHTGNKSFLVTKRVDGKLINVTIGKFLNMPVAEARKKALLIIASLNSGINPTEAKRKKAKEQTPLGEVFEQYLAKRRKNDIPLKPCTVKDYQIKLTLGFSDWLKKPVNRITEDMVLDRHRLITENNGKTTANTTFRVLRLTLNYAIVNKMINENPTKTLNKSQNDLWHTNNRKKDIITKDQLKAWHEAVEALTNEPAKVYFLLALYMGFRSNELLTLEWSHVDMQAQTIELKNTKNGSDHLLPIPAVVMPYVKALNVNTGSSRWVFTGDDPAKHITRPAKQIRAVIKASGVTFTPHDCRRTFATIAEAVSLPMSMIKRLMNHVTTNDVTGGYIVTEEETLRLAINKVAEYIQSKVTEKDNVIQLHAKK
jgi:integrase